MDGSIYGSAYLLGYKINNYLAPATAFTTLATQVWTVPANKRWLLLGGVCVRDANETVTIYARDASNNNLVELLNEGAAIATNHYPEYAEVPMPFILDEGEDIAVTFGGNQGAGAELSCVVIEVSV